MSDTVAKPSAAIAAMRAAAEKGRALMGGTTAMREAGTTYLPRFDAESQTNYDARLKASWLFNGYRKTVRDMAGRVFDKPVEIAEGSDQLRAWAENIDLAGRDLSTFARDVFEDGLSGAGVSYIMVDAPPRDGMVTRAQAQAENLRPYLVHLTIQDVLGWKSEIVNNAPRLTMLRIMEEITEPDPKDEFNEEPAKQIRVLDMPEGANGVRTRLYRKNEKGKWIPYGEETFSGLQEITVIPFYANRVGFFTGAPLLDDLADVNIAHWQSQSDQRNILHFARVPILFGAGFGEDDTLTISASAAVKADDPQAKLQWVEHSGQAIGAGRQDLKDLEFQMETHGLQLLVARQGAQSATGEALDAAKETSQLAMIADNLQDALEVALVWMTVYAGAEESVSVTVNKDFGVSMMGPQELAVMLNAVQSGNLSRATLISEMVRRGVLRSDLSPEDEEERIATEAPAMTGNPMGLGDDAA